MIWDFFTCFIKQFHSPLQKLEFFLKHENTFSNMATYPLSHE